MSMKHKKIWTGLNCIENLIMLTSAVARCVSTSVFAYLVGISTNTATSAVGLKISTWTGWFKKYNSMIKKSNKIVLLAKTKLHHIEFTFLGI